MKMDKICDLQLEYGNIAQTYCVFIFNAVVGILFTVFKDQCFYLPIITFGT